MEFQKLRIALLLKLFSVVLLVSISIYFFGNEYRKNHLFSFFSTRCLDYKQKDFSRKLNDRIVDYSVQAKLKGIKPCKDENELKKRISEGKLLKVKTGKKYLVEKMTYSYPYVTHNSKYLLEEISTRFRQKTSQKGLKGVRFIVTSMTRKTDGIKNLRRNNQNASANSPHIYGNAFDISYKRFDVRKWSLTNCDKKFLKEALAEVIWQLSEEKKCWATYERMQNCYHIVAQ